MTIPQSVTILIPCYNGAQYLRRCLDSCLQQTYPNLEILVINDGSTDATQSIVEAYKAAFANINLINQSNQGLAKTRNLLIQHCTTTYGYFLDADDWLEPDCIEYLVGAIGTNELVISPSWINTQRRQKPFFVTTKITAQTTNETYLIHNTPFAWNILFRLDYVRAARFCFLESAPFFEDAGLMSFLIYETKKIAFLPTPKYHYFVAKESLSRANITRTKIESALQQLAHFYQLIGKYQTKGGYPRPLNDQLALYHCIIFTYIQFQSRLRRHARRHYRTKLKNLEQSHHKLQYPRRYWKFWYFLLYRSWGY